MVNIILLCAALVAAQSTTADLVRDAERIVPDATLKRPYHLVTLAQMATTTWTHVCTVGPVVYRRLMQDGDWHVTLDNGAARVIVEIIPLIPLPVPTKGQVIEACGISRFDRRHGWPEVHPAESIRVLK